MFSWVLNIPLIFKFLTGKLSRILFHVKINFQLTHSSRGSCMLCNINKSVKSYFFRSFLFYLISKQTCSSVIYITILSSLSLQLYLLQDEASPLIKEGRSKRMDIQGHTPAKTLIFQFHLHLSTNKQVASRLQDIVHLIYFYYQYLS